jgi:serine/threonine protein kinase
MPHATIQVVVAKDELGLTGLILDRQVRIEEYVGEGDLSVVYKGHHLGLDAPVAVKVLNLPVTLEPALVTSFVRSFVEGAGLHYRLSAGHLHIARSITSGHVRPPNGRDETPYLVREWLEGMSLATNFSVRRAEGHNGRRLDEAVELFAPVASALAFAHRQGVIHGRLNPANLFVADGRLKVLDFGVARAMHDGRRDLEHPRGTNELQLFYPSYAAPEQYEWEHGEVGPWTDVYALALLILEALRDRPAIAVRATVDCIQKVCDRSARPTPRSLAIALSREVDAVITRAVALKASERYKDAVEFWEALERAASAKVKTAGAHASGAGPRPQSGYRAPMPTRLGIAPQSTRPISVPPPPPLAAVRTSAAPPAPAIRTPAPASAIAPAPPLPSPSTSSTAPPSLAPSPVASAGAEPPAPAPVALKPPAPVMTPVPTSPPLQAATEPPPPAPPPWPAAAAGPPPAPPPPSPPAPEPIIASPVGPYPYPSDRSVWITTRDGSTIEAPPVTAPRRVRSRLGRRSDRGVLAAFGAAGAVVALLVILGAHVIAARGSTSSHPVAALAAAIAVPASAPPPAPPPPEPAAPPVAAFDWKAARAALAATEPAMQACASAGGRHGRGLIRVLFAPDGSVQAANAVGPFARTKEGACVAEHATEARTAPFRGGPRAIIYTFSLSPQ